MRVVPSSLPGLAAAFKRTSDCRTSLPTAHHNALVIGLRSQIVYAVSFAFGISIRELRKNSRGRARAAFARQVAMYLAHVGCSLTLTETGQLFNRDRTTVAHACAVVEDRRDDPMIDQALAWLELIARRFSRPIANTR